MEHLSTRLIKFFEIQFRLKTVFILSLRFVPVFRLQFYLICIFYPVCILYFVVTDWTVICNDIPSPTPLTLCPKKFCPIGHFQNYHNTLCLFFKILHKHWIQFLSGLLLVPRKTQNNKWKSLQKPCTIKLALRWIKDRSWPVRKIKYQKKTARTGQTTCKGVNTIFRLANTSLLQVYWWKMRVFIVFILTGNDTKWLRDASKVTWEYKATNMILVNN